MSALLPHLSGALNAAVAALLLLALRAIRRGERERHRRRMLGATAVGLVFVATYVLQTLLEGGHRRFPGDDWVRTLFVAILASHTVLSILLVPLLATTLAFGLRGRFDAHRRLARLTFPIWLYVAVTGVAIYGMNRYVRPVAPVAAGFAASGNTPEPPQRAQSTSSPSQPEGAAKRSRSK